MIDQGFGGTIEGDVGEGFSLHYSSAELGL